MSQLVRTASPATPATPATPVTAPSTPAGRNRLEGTPTGSWRHPKFDEITRRQYATNFDERNVKIILSNGGLLLFSFIAPAVVSQIGLLHALVYVVAIFDGC